MTTTTRRHQRGLRLRGQGGGGGDSEMRLLRRTSSMGGGGGGRGLRRAESLPRSPPALAPRASLAKTESFKKRDNKTTASLTKKGSKRARLRAGISAALRDLHLASGHRRHAGRRGGGGRDDDGGDGGGAVAATAPLAIGVLLRADADARPAAAAASSSRFSWAVAVALVLVLACVVALGRGPAICCCTCAAWWCGGGRAADPPACRPRRSGGVRHSSVQPEAGCLQQ